MDPSIIVIANEVVRNIKVQLDPTIDQNQRVQAYQIHEEFKRNSPHCSEVGFYIFSKELNFESPIRLCGLLFVEWFVQNKWDTVEPIWHDQMKIKATKLIESADFKEEDCLKGAIVRVVVEVIKRSWPQLWGSLFEDLSYLQRMGDAQLELVLIILMRLSEDLNGLDDKVKQQRRKDMVSTLNKHLGDLFQFFIATIHEKVVKLRESSVNGSENLRLTTAALNTITEFATWVNFEFLITKEKVLFQVLFWLLEIDEIKYNASNCLSCIFERKGEHEKRMEMLVILSDDALSIIENTLQKTVNLAASGDIEEYRFLKKLNEMLVNFGVYQIAALWGDDRGFKERPTCFARYLKLMLDFTKHDSMVINIDTLKLWHSFSHHKEIPNDEIFLAAIELLPKEILRMMTRFSHPMLTDNPGTKYTLMDVDELEEYHTSFNLIRPAAINVLSQISLYVPEITLQFVCSKAEEQLNLKLTDVTGYSADQLALTPYFMLWDSYQLFCRTFFMTFFMRQKEALTPVNIQRCIQYFQSLIEYSTDIPACFTPIISTMESLFPVLKYSPELITPCLQKLSSVMQMASSGEEMYKKYRHKMTALFALKHLCMKSPDLLTDKFDDLVAFFGAKIQENIFSNIEKRNLLEGLINVSNTLKDRGKVKAFIDKVFMTPLAYFRRDDMKDVFSSTSNFIKYLGFDMDEENDNGAAYARRGELIMTLYTLISAARAFRTFSDEDKIKDDPSDDEIMQMVTNCPWMQHMVDLLPYLFDLARQLCLLWSVADQMSSSYKTRLLQMNNEFNPHATKNDADDDDDEETTTFKPNKQFPVYTLHLSICECFSYYPQCMGAAFFSLPGMMESFTDKVLKSWVYYPNYRIYIVWRSIVKTFSLQCPAKYYATVLGPFLAVAIEQIYERLSYEWNRLQEMAPEKRLTKNTEKDDQSEEISEQRITYNLSKTVIDVLVNLCLYKRNKKDLKTEDNSELIGKLGEFLLTYSGTNLQLITIFFSALTWPEGTVIPRLCTAITAIVRKIFVPENPVNVEIPKQMLLRCLQGLQVHGGDDIAVYPIVSTTFAVYLQLRQQYPDIVNIMMMVPTCREEDLKQFDISMFLEEEYTKKLNEKTKRKRFLKLLQGAIGKTVSQLHKNDVKIQDLPPLAPRVKPPKPDVIVNTDDAALSLLFVPDE